MFRASLNLFFSIRTQMLQLGLSQHQLLRNFSDCVLTDEAKKSAVYYLNGERQGRERGSDSRYVAKACVAFI